MKWLKLKLLAARIELQWWFIRRERRRGKKLLETGFSLSSQKILELNNRFSKHCTKVMTDQRKYERMADICATSQRMRT